MNFDAIQTFYIDPVAVNFASTVLLTSVDLFFRTQPAQTDNASGVYRPGVKIMLTDATQDTPDLTRVYQNSVVRNDYSAIFPLSDASVPSNFKFAVPIPLVTGKYYAIVIQFEDPGYSLWSVVQGDRLVNTNTPAQGPAGQYDGYYFDATNANGLVPRSDIDLKFRVYTAQFFANTTSVTFVPDSYEFVKYDARSGNTFIGGERVYQMAGNTSANIYFNKPGTLLINASSNTVLGNGTNFSSTLVANSYVLLTDRTLGNTILRQVGYVINTTAFVLSEAPSFSTTGYAGYYQVTPVAEVFSADYVANSVFLRKSTANATVRFTNNSIGTAVITAGGTSYSNADYVTVSGGGSTLNAVANITTNSTGGIISLNFSNVGSGFTSAPTVTITTATGSTGTITVNTSHIGLSLVGTMSKGSANIANLETKPINQIIPNMIFSVPAAGRVNAFYDFTYYDGANYKVLAANQKEAQINQINDVTSYSALIMSRSMEVINTSYLYNNDRSGYIRVDMTMNRSNTDLFESPLLMDARADLFVFENDINNSSANEHLDTGNAISKHISQKIAYANNKFAEDLRAYLTAYKPSGTDIKVYARIHNSRDPEAFDDKYWTELELKDGIGQNSSVTDPNDFIEFTYGFPQYPATGSTLTGTVSTSNGSATVTGSNTTFNTDLAANDMVKVYSPIFPNNYQIGIVNSVTNSTQIILKTAIVNTNIAESVVGTGLKIDKLTLKNTGFNNIQNDNVVRYYSQSLVEYDTYDSVALKIVLLANNVNLVPRVTSYSAIGVSA